jgi:ribosomal protein S17E
MLCETLAAGKPLYAQGKVLLNKYDLVSGMFDHFPDEANKAVVDTLTDPDSGLPEVKSIARQAAEKLVEDFSGRFKQDIENDIRKGDAA